jgi:hypothetical protein
VRYLFVCCVFDLGSKREVNLKVLNVPETEQKVGSRSDLSSVSVKVRCFYVIRQQILDWVMFWMRKQEGIILQNHVFVWLNCFDNIIPVQKMCLEIHANLALTN